MTEEKIFDCIQSKTKIVFRDGWLFGWGIPKQITDSGIVVIETKTRIGNKTNVFVLADNCFRTLGDLFTDIHGEKK